MAVPSSILVHEFHHNDLWGATDRDRPGVFFYVSDLRHALFLGRVLCLSRLLHRFPKRRPLPSWYSAVLSSINRFLAFHHRKRRTHHAFHRSLRLRLRSGQSSAFAQGFLLFGTGIAWHHRGTT